MNWLIRWGQWLESRRVLRKSDLHNILSRVNIAENNFKENYQRSGSASAELFNRHDERIKALEAEEKIPQTIAKELALIKARLDRLELLTGLKREPEAVHVKGTPRIE